MSSRLPKRFSGTACCADARSAAEGAIDCTHSERSLALQRRVEAFMQQHVYPVGMLAAGIRTLS
jgi:hypothetical protein